MSAFGGKADIGRCPLLVRNARQTGRYRLARKVLFHSEYGTRRACIVHQLAALAVAQSGVKRVDDRGVSVLYSNLLMMGQTDSFEPILQGQNETKARKDCTPVVLTSYRPTQRNPDLLYRAL